MANSLGGLVAIHNGHLDIHQHQIVIILRSFLDHLHSDGAIGGLLHSKAGSRQNLVGNFAIELIVLHHQNTLAFKGNRLLLCLFLRQNAPAGPRRLDEHAAQIGHKEGLITEGCYPGLPCLLLNIRPIVGRENNDGRFVADNTANATHRLNAIHLGHHPVDDVAVEGIPIIVGLLRPEDGLATRGSPLRAHADLSQHLGNTVAGLEIIVHNKSAQTLQLHSVLFFVHHAAQGKIEAHSKGAAPVDLALHLDGAAHHVHRVLGDSHAQSRALDAADSGALFPFEGVKYMLQKVVAHADAAVADDEIIMGMTGLFGLFLTNSEGHHATNGRELGRVAQNIDKHLVQAQGVENKLLVLHINGVHIKLQAFGPHLGTNHIHQIMNTLGEIAFLLLNDNLAAFNAAHIQNIVNEAQQMIAGAHDFF